MLATGTPPSVTQNPCKSLGPDPRSLEKAYRLRRTIWDKGTRTVSWDDDLGRLNRIVLALALLAAVGWACPPFFGMGG